MILYFSGTGNSEYAAKRIGRELDDKVLNLVEKIRIPFIFYQLFKI